MFCMSFVQTKTSFGVFLSLNMKSEFSNYICFAGGLKLDLKLKVFPNSVWNLYTLSFVNYIVYSKWVNDWVVSAFAKMHKILQWIMSSAPRQESMTNMIPDFVTDCWLYCLKKRIWFHQSVLKIGFVYSVNKVNLIF